MIKKADLSGKGYRVLTPDGKDLGGLLSIWPVWKKGDEFFEQWNLGEDVADRKEDEYEGAIVVHGDKHGFYQSIEKIEGKSIILKPDSYDVRPRTPNTPEELFAIPMNPEVKKIKADYHSLIVRRAFENLEDKRFRPMQNKDVFDMLDDIVVPSEIPSEGDRLRNIADKISDLAQKLQAEHFDEDIATWEGFELLRQMQKLIEEYKDISKGQGIKQAHERLSVRADFEGEWLAGELGVAHLSDEQKFNLLQKTKAKIKELTEFAEKLKQVVSQGSKDIFKL